MLSNPQNHKNAAMIFASLLIFQLLSKMYDKYIMTAQALTYARTTGKNRLIMELTAKFGRPVRYEKRVRITMANKIL